jgi:hypothetical protein
LNFVDLHDLSRQGAEGVSYRLAAAEEAWFRAPPRFMFGPVPRQFGEWHYGDRLAPKVGLFTLENFSLVTEKFLFRDEIMFCIPQNGIHFNVSGIEEAFEKVINTKIIEEEVVLLTGPAYQMYGHWLVEFQTKLHVLTVLGYDLAKLKYLLPHNLLPFSYNWLDALGISRAQIINYDVVIDRCEIKRALIPTNVRGSSRANTLLADTMRDYKERILGQTTQDAPLRKIYLSRERWGNSTRALSNAAEMESIFQTNGFDIVYPEKLSLIEQVRLFSECKFLAGDYGSALHNSIFAPSAATIIALRGTEGHPGFLQSGLCEAVGQNYGYIFGQTKIINNQQSYAIDAKDASLCIDLAVSSPY